MHPPKTLISGFYRLSPEQRRKHLKELCGLSEEDLKVLSGQTAVSPDQMDSWIENVIGYFPLPLGLATHFVIDGQPRWIPMAVEETSVIAAASATAKWIANAGTLTTSLQGHWVIGQVQIPYLKSSVATQEKLLAQKSQLIQCANACVPGLVNRGGGVQEISIRLLDRADHQGQMLVLHIFCDPCDAMGANLMNQICEALKQPVEVMTGEKVGLCILSNLVDTKCVQAQVILEEVDPQVAEGIEEASCFAQTDPYRATTHNKGVLNGIDPVLIATGNDWRAVEAGVHAYAARTGKYQPVTQWKRLGSTLQGDLQIPLAVGTVGGLTRIHPTAQVALKILKVTQAHELARICAAVGLVQNLGALKALSTEGIVLGHMQLHAANLAIAAGAQADEIPVVRDRLVQHIKVDRQIHVTLARKILEQLRLDPLKVPPCLK